MEFGISEEDASGLVNDSIGQIQMFRIWLKKAPQTWKNLVDVLHKIDENHLADELQDKIKRKGSYIPSLCSYVCIYMHLHVLIVGSLL